jgi:hypothetical protein
LIFYKRNLENGTTDYIVASLDPTGRIKSCKTMNWLPEDSFYIDISGLYYTYDAKGRVENITTTSIEQSYSIGGEGLYFFKGDLSLDEVRLLSTDDDIFRYIAKKNCTRCGGGYTIELKY